MGWFNIELSRTKGLITRQDPATMKPMKQVAVNVDGGDPQGAFAELFDLGGLLLVKCTQRPKDFGPHEWREELLFATSLPELRAALNGESGGLPNVSTLMQMAGKALLA